MSAQNNNKKITKNIVFGDPPPSGAPTTFTNNTLLFEIGTGNIHQFINGSWTVFSGPTKQETLLNKTIDVSVASGNTITGIKNANIDPAAAISYPKLNLTGSIVDADINASASISRSKLGALSIGDSDIIAHTSTKITISNKAQLPVTVVYTDQSNSFGAFSQIFQNTRLKIKASSGTFNYVINTSAITTADKNITLPLLTADDTFVFAAFAQTLTNKTISVAANTITDSSPAAGDIIKSDGTKYVKLPRGTNGQVLASSGTDIAWTSFNAAANTWSAAQTFLDTDLLLRNPANTFSVTLGAGAQTAAKTFTFPVISGASDTINTATSTVTQSNKTIPVDQNTINHSTTNAAGDILKSDGTKYNRLARGSANQVLASTGTDIAWSTFNAENTGKATGTANGSTTVYNIAHSIGAIPSVASVQCSSHSNAFTYTTDATNIIVTFATAPSSTPSTAVFYWRAVA